MAIDPDVQVLLDELALQIDTLTQRVTALEAGVLGGNFDVTGTFTGAVTPLPVP